MIVSYLRFRRRTHKPHPNLILTFSFHTRSLLPYKPEPTNWNTNHSFILSNPLLSLLEKCKSVSQMKQIQTQMIVTGLILDGLAASRLIAFCSISASRNLGYCKIILNSLHNQNVFSWNVIIRGYCESEKPEESVLLYREMLRRNNGLRPDNHTYPVLLKCCTKLSLIWMGFAVIGHVIRFGLGSDLYVNNAVIHLLVSCGEIDDARQVFDESCVRDLVSWNSIINGYVKNGRPWEALKLYRKMEEDRINRHLLNSSIASNSEECSVVVFVHKEVPLIYDELPFICFVMIVSYLRFRRRTHKPHPNLILTFSFHTRSLLPYKPEPTNWNTNHSFILSNPLLSLLEKCKSVSQMKQIQTQMIVTGLILDGLAASRLIAFCSISASRNLGYCKIILNSLHNQNVFSWNVIIRGYCESEKPEESVLLYREMLRRNNGLRPDNHTYPVLLKCCTKLSLIWMGFAVIGHVIRFGLGSDLYVNNAVIHLLVSCGEIDDARQVFDESCVRDLVSWNSIINGYVKNGRPWEALKLYRKMEEDRINPDEVTMIGIISSCAQLENLNLGTQFHNYIEENQITKTVPLSNALIDMYVKCGNIESAKSIFDKMTKKTIVSWTTMIVGYGKYGYIDDARKLFDEMPERNVVPWNAIIGGYIETKRFKDALSTFHEMQALKINPDEVTMVYYLSACSQLGALDLGIWIHHYITKHNLSINVALGTSLVNMYAKCGNIKKALQVFNEIPSRNSLSWTAIIVGLANHGYAHDAISYFSEMIKVGLTPDDVTFLGVLSACCHGGLVNEGRIIFSQMTSKFNVFPKRKHYSCMVDLFGRAGLLKEAEEFIENMPITADETVWGALFFACRIHGNVEMGEKAAFKLLELDPSDSGIYVLLATMYWEAKMFEKSIKIRKSMKEKGVEKTPGCSSIEVNGDVFEFIIRENNHPRHQEINECLVHFTKHFKGFEDLKCQFHLV